MTGTSSAPAEAYPFMTETRWPRNFFASTFNEKVICHLRLDM